MQALRRIEAGLADQRGRREILERDLAELKQHVAAPGCPATRRSRTSGRPGSNVHIHTRAVTADTALRLARSLGTSERFWLNLQAGYALEAQKDRLGNRLAKEVRVLAAAK